MTRERRRERLKRAPSRGQGKDTVGLLVHGKSAGRQRCGPFAVRHKSASTQWTFGHETAALLSFCRPNPAVDEGGQNARLQGSHRARQPEPRERFVEHRIVAVIDRTELQCHGVEYLGVGGKSHTV